MNDEEHKQFEDRFAYWQEQESTRRMAEVDKKMTKKEVFERLNPKKKFRIKTGFSKLDTATAGLESQRTYVIGGLNKSGKSTLLMNMLNNMLLNGLKVGVLDTELGQEDYIKRFSAIANRIHEYDTSNESELQDSFREVFIQSNQLQYAYKSDILVNGVMDINQILLTFEEWRHNGCQIFCVDNITTISNSISGNRKGYEVLRSYVEKLIDYARDKNIVLILVLHTKGGELKYSESSANINRIIDEKDPHKIFEKSVVVNTRPSVTSLYGGQSILSQVSGGVLLLWRPFQDFRDPMWQKMALLILEDFRSKPREFINEVELEFDPETSSYAETPLRG